MRLRGRWSRRVTQRCGQCGADSPAEARWCGGCGAPLGRTADELERLAEAEQAEAEPAPDGRAGRVLAAATVATVLLGLLTLQAAQPEPVMPAGFASRGDGARSGVVSVTAPPQPRGVAWRAPVALPPLLTPGADVLGTTTVDGGEAVVVLDPAEAGWRVTTHGVADGSIRSTTMLPLGNQPYATTLSDGLLAHRDLRSVTLVDLATAERRWTVDVRLREQTVLTPFGVVGVQATLPTSVLTLLSLDDGSPVWELELPADGRIARIVPLGETIAVVLQGDTGTSLVGVDARTGAFVWEVLGSDLPRPGASIPRVVTATDGERLLVAGPDELVLVDERGEARAAPLTGIGAPDLVLGAMAGDLVVLSDGVERLLALDVSADTPRVVWSTTPPGAPVFDLAVSDGVLAVRGDGATTLLDAATGDMITRVDDAGGDPPRVLLTSEGELARVTSAGMLELTGATGLRLLVPTVAVHLPDLATDDGAVAVTTPAGVEVFDVADGTRRFAHEAFQANLVTAGSLTAPTLDGGRVTVAPPLTQPPDRGGLLSLFADSGIVDWARRDDRVVPRGTPVVDRDLYVLPVGSQLLGFDRTNGVRRLVVETSIARADVAAAGDWLVAVDAPRDVGDVWVGRRSTRSIVFRAPIRTCAPPVIHQDLTLLTTHLGDIIARRLEDGEQPWGERAGGSACRPLTVVGDTLVALVDDRELLGVGLDDGETSWRAALSATAAGAPVAAGDLVLVPTVTGTIEAWTVGADAPVWTVDVDGVPAGAVAVDGDTVLVLTRAGELVALR